MTPHDKCRQLNCSIIKRAIVHGYTLGDVSLDQNVCNVR